MNKVVMVEKSQTQHRELSHTKVNLTKATAEPKFPYGITPQGNQSLAWYYIIFDCFHHERGNISYYNRYSSYAFIFLEFNVSAKTTTCDL